MAPSKRRRGLVSLGSSVVGDRPAWLLIVEIKFVISVQCNYYVNVMVGYYKEVVSDSAEEHDMY